MGKCYPEICRHTYSEGNVWLAISPWPWRWVGYAGEISAELIFWSLLFLVQGTYHERLQVRWL